MSSGGVVQLLCLSVFAVLGRKREKEPGCLHTKCGNASKSGRALKQRCREEEVLHKEQDLLSEAECGTRHTTDRWCSWTVGNHFVAA